MTLNLKLVRHHDGKWTALPTETDDISPVSVKERKSAPIDPAQLLKALDSLLSPKGGIRSIEDVTRLASLMKKFSKKLVSRCVYCNVLQATEPDILSDYLDKGGWDTINTWLKYAKSSSSDSFLIELLKLCKQLPMTLNRLKENNTAKLVKSLTKHDNREIKTISSDLVNQWMTIIKGKKAEEAPAIEKKKKSKTEKKTAVKEEKKEEPKACFSPKHAIEVPKSPVRSKGLKRTSIEKDSKKAEIYEDVKIDPEPLMPISKKLKTDRPKTAKIYNKKFRSTGLEEETPLPKNISKKTTVVDKSVVAAAKNALKLNPCERITEKKIKPENLLAVNESANTKGIKLIPAKPRPTVLHESASFMDALISQPIVPVKRKKKVASKTSPAHSASGSTPPTPTSPTMVPPKLQFYKDTLEMNDNEAKQEAKNEESPNEEPEKTTDKVAEDADTTVEEIVPMDTSEEGGNTPKYEEAGTNDVSSANEDDVFSASHPSNALKVQSILVITKKPGPKKSVRWVEDDHIKETYYFEMDETERVNVSRNQLFGDLKSIEVKREREAMEMAKRQGNDKVEEFQRWWLVPVDCPPPLVVPGCSSMERIIEIQRQEKTLQEIYFTREMTPDSPHEPDLEIFAPKEPKIIPLDEENAIGSFVDYSHVKVPKPAVLQDILSSIMKINTSQPLTQLTETISQMPMDTSIPQIPHSQPQPTVLLPHSQPFEPEILPPSTTVLSHGPPPPMHPAPLPHFSPPVEEPMMKCPGEWKTLNDLPPSDHFFGGFPGSQNIPPEPFPSHSQNVRHGSNSYRPFRGGPRQSVPRPPRRVVCRHFTANGCRFGINCSFLHPGVNGPPLM